LQAVYGQNDFLKLKSGNNAVQLKFDGANCPYKNNPAWNVSGNFEDKAISYIHVNDGPSAFIAKADSVKPKGGNGEFSLGWGQIWTVNTYFILALLFRWKTSIKFNIWHSAMVNQIQARRTYLCLILT
jgi:hypothetical protein